MGGTLGDAPFGGPSGRCGGRSPEGGVARGWSPRASPTRGASARGTGRDRSAAAPRGRASGRGRSSSRSPHRPEIAPGGAPDCRGKGRGSGSGLRRGRNPRGSLRRPAGRSLSGPPPRRRRGPARPEAAAGRPARRVRRVPGGEGAPRFTREAERRAPGQAPDGPRPDAAAPGGGIPRDPPARRAGPDVGAVGPARGGSRGSTGGPREGARRCRRAARGVEGPFRSRSNRRCRPAGCEAGAALAGGVPSALRSEDRPARGFVDGRW